MESADIDLDGWMADTVWGTVTHPNPAQPLMVLGEIPPPGDPAFQTQVTLLIDHCNLFTQVRKSGMFKVRFSDPMSGQ